MSFVKGLLLAVSACFVGCFGLLVLATSALFFGFATCAAVVPHELRAAACEAVELEVASEVPWDFAERLAERALGRSEELGWRLASRDGDRVWIAFEGRTRGARSCFARALEELHLEGIVPRNSVRIVKFVKISYGGFVDTWKSNAPPGRPPLDTRPSGR